MKKGEMVLVERKAWWEEMKLACSLEEGDRGS